MAFMNVCNKTHNIDTVIFPNVFDEHIRSKDINVEENVGVIVTGTLKEKSMIAKKIKFARML